jgi:uncharacterized protein
MEILKNILAQDLFLYLKKYNTFILSDIHLGYEESLNRQGIFVPRNNYNDLLIRLEKSLESIKKTGKIEQIILNGDLIHEFGKIHFQEKTLLQKFLKFLSDYGVVIVIEGNHDKGLKYFKDNLKNGVKILEYVLLGEILIMHGDKIPDKELLKNNVVKTIIIGHEHPSVAISSGTRVEKYKCFLKGKYFGRNLLVLPSCNLFIEGTDVLRERLLSPFLKDVSIKNFDVFVIEDKIYDFGKIRSLLKLG